MSSTVNRAANVSWMVTHGLWLGPMGEETSNGSTTQPSSAPRRSLPPLNPELFPSLRELQDETWAVSPQRERLQGCIYPDWLCWCLVLLLSEGKTKTTKHSQCHFLVVDTGGLVRKQEVAAGLGHFGAVLVNF